jgi:catechol 2,3-dioxygenase-like lactoylglutathione lyase family enzyme
MSRVEVEVPVGTPYEDVHAGLHSEQGAFRGEHPGRARNPLIKVVDLAWLEFEKPDLDRAQRFLVDFGFLVTDRTPDELRLRATWSSAPCLVVRRGPRSRYVGHAMLASSREDLTRLARGTGSTVEAHRGGHAVRLVDPSGFEVRVVAGVPEVPALPERAPLPLNFGATTVRPNEPQRPLRAAAEVQRLGHVALETARFGAALDWYLETLGLIVSDFLFLDDLRAHGPTMAFMRCDRGSAPSDHHTIAMYLGPKTGYSHSAYQVTDLDAVAVGGEFLRERGYQRVWGIGRHIQGSQIFDYWRDPDRMMFEHFADGDRFDCSIEPGWSPMSASGLAQWGPPVSRDFLGTKPHPTLVRAVLKALAVDDNDLDPRTLRALMKAMSA